MGLSRVVKWVGLTAARGCTCTTFRSTMARPLGLLLLAVYLLPAVTEAKLDPSISTQLLWPMPSSVTVGSQVFSIDPAGFKFTPGGANAASDTLKQAIDRYSDLIFKSPVPLYPSAANTTAGSALSGLTITVSSTNESLGLNTDESC